MNRTSEVVTAVQLGSIRPGTRRYFCFDGAAVVVLVSEEHVELSLNLASHPSYVHSNLCAYIVRPSFC
jgi:hypothetical protein